MSDTPNDTTKPPFEETEVYKETIALSKYFEQVMDTELKKSEVTAALFGIEMDWQSIRAVSDQSSKDKLDEYLDQLRQRYDRGEL